MGSIFDIPSGLLFVLSLVTTNPNDSSTTATGHAAPKSPAAIAVNKASCRHGDQAWLAALNQGAGGVAFSALAGRIFKTSAGRFYVPVAQDRKQILDLKRDNAVACFIALSSAANNAHRLKRDLGRHATVTDLYVAHIFGARQAAEVLKAAARTPHKRMFKLFPALDEMETALYAGRNESMTVGYFVKQMRSAVARQLNGSSATPSRHVKKQKQRSRPKKTAKRRIKALVQKVNVSARELLQRGPQKELHVATEKRKTDLSTRFSFGVGLPKQEQNKKSAKSDRSISF